MPSDRKFGVRLTVAYDGTDFAGWQNQPGRRTVEGVIAEAAQAMSGHAVDIRAASRTDAGVHALGQVCAFATDREIPDSGWMRGMNSELPEDVAVRAAHACAPDYNPRFDASGKHYRYLVHHGGIRSPLERRRAWHLRAVPDEGLDLSAMRTAAAAFIGTHDFRAFRGADDHREVTTRTLERLDLEALFENVPGIVAFHVQGNAFLKNMVRILVGTLVEVGLGRRSPDSIPALLDPGSRREHAGQTAPAHGLTLMSVSLRQAR